MIHIRDYFIFILLVFLLVSCNNSDKQVEQNNEHRNVHSEQTESIMLPDDSLQKGDEGESVGYLQQFLSEIGYDIDISNVYDELTTWAITDLQLQLDSDEPTGVYDEQTKLLIESVLAKEQQISIGKALEKPKQPDIFTETIENPYDILVLVNKQYALPDHFEPVDLTVPDVRFPFDEDDPKKQLRKVAANALEEMFEQADKDGVELFAQSGYRSFERQEAIFAANVKQHGEEKANTYSARPGESEHQTGLVMDVTSQEINFLLEIDFAHTKEGKWIKKHAHKYGFIIRYPEGKEAITKYQYEPWHLRYVGKKAATEITENNLTLEEYLDTNH